MKAIGIDLGGTKIESQLFDDNWDVAARKRVATPKDYDGLIVCVADLANWARHGSDHQLPIGVSAAGLVNKPSGLAVTANLPATGHPILADIEAAIGQKVSLINDCRAFTLSEAVFGAGKRDQRVVGLIIGTGLGAGFALNGTLYQGAAGLAGEIGHTSVPAAEVLRHSLSLLPCGCGAEGCFEPYLSGPGLERLVAVKTGMQLSSPEIAALRGIDPQINAAWAIWINLAGTFLRNVQMNYDPDVVVLGGGPSLINGLIPELETAFQARRLGQFGLPRLALAQGGDASGARGAAHFATQNGTLNV